MKHYCKNCNKQINFDEYRIAIDKHEKALCEKCLKNTILYEELNDDKEK